MHPRVRSVYIRADGVLHYAHDHPAERSARHCKSTLAEALSESMERCVMLDGDRLVAATPPASDELEHLHSTIALLVAHHRSFGYLYFAIDHIWTSPAQLADLRRRLIELDDDVRCFLLTLPVDDNLRRIQRPASARAVDEREEELRTFSEEREALAGSHAQALGEPFDVSVCPRRTWSRGGCIALGCADIGSAARLCFRDRRFPVVD